MQNTAKNTAGAGLVGTTAIVGTAVDEAADGFRVLIRPNRSLTPISMLMFMGGFSILTLSIAIVFLLQGYWVVLPFAGLEIIFVAAAFWYVSRKGEDYDLVAVDDRRVSISQRVDGRESAHEFDRHWVRLSLEPGARRLHAPRLFIGSHGQRVEIARALPEEGREELRHQLAAVLRRSYDPDAEDYDARDDSPAVSPEDSPDDSNGSAAAANGGKSDASRG